MERTREIIDNSHDQDCYNCLGTGYSVGPGITRKQAMQKKCTTCKGTGKWHEEHYFLVTSDNKGNKICFDVDNIGK